MSLERAIEQFKKQPEPKLVPQNDVERKFLRVVKDESAFIKSIIKRSAPKENPDNYIPEILEMDMETFLDVYPDWLRWRALDKRYPPTVIRQQPRALLDAFIYLDSLLEKYSSEFYMQLRKKRGEK